MDGEISDMLSAPLSPLSLFMRAYCLLQEINTKCLSLAVMYTTHLSVLVYKQEQEPIRACNYVKRRISASTKTSNTLCSCVNVNVAERARDQSSIFSTVQ